MRVLHLSTSDIEGGAARAANRLHQGLKTIGVDSQMLVRAKDSLDKTVTAKQDILTKLGPIANGLPLKLYQERDRSLFSPQWFSDSVVGSVRKIEPKIINLHWICNGFLKIENLAKFNKPIVWTLQDMWAFTGGCHYTNNCDLYTDSCRSCPQLHSSKQRDLSNWIWQRKAKAWKNLNLTIVAPSSWMAKCAASSSLFQDLRIEVIPFCLDTTKYKPINKKVARESLNLPQDKRLIMFGALAATKDRRKGFHLLIHALQSLKLSEWQDKIELVVFGASLPENPIDLGFKANYLGHLSDDVSLAIVYSAADVMIVPSIQESFGQAASESLACGTPVVAFNDTGLKDIVEHQQNGYLAKAYEVEDLAKGIGWVLEHKERHQQLRIQARQKAEQEFNLPLQAKRYLSLYQEVLKTKA